MIFKEYVSKERGLSDLLNYAHLVEDGIIINKDGAYLKVFKFQGPDINSATSTELDTLSQMINRMVTFLGDGWMLHVDEVRIPSRTYPKPGFFPDTVSALIDDERREFYQSEGEHYENLQFLVFVWKFPQPTVKMAKHWFIEGVDRNESHLDLNKLLDYFNETILKCTQLLHGQLYFQALNSADLLSYLNICITGSLAPVAVPPSESFLDVVLARQPVVGGYYPKIGHKYLKVLSIVGYLNQETVPGLLEHMATYPLIYRWSNRFIPLSEASAELELKRYRKQWHNKVKGLVGIMREAILNKPTQKIDNDALSMKNETEMALTLNRNHSVRFGFWSSAIVLMHEDKSLMDMAVKELRGYLIQRGFECIEEEVNAFDAWIGTIPGQGSANVRRIFMTSQNLAHVLPLHTIWTGDAICSSSSLLPKNSPPVFYAATTGKTPFRFHLDVGDVGHQIMIGPTGAGKSTYLGFLVAQFFRYKNAQVFIFDKDYSHRALTEALEGNYYDIGNAKTLAFCPLADLSTPTKKMRAEQFIETLVELQNIPITPSIRSEIHKAMESLSHKNNIGRRSLTVFRSLVQQEDVRNALEFYSLQGQFKLLDAEDTSKDQQNSLNFRHLQSFEMGWLLNQKPDKYIPVLCYIFDQIESTLEEYEGKVPVLIVLEEAWLYVQHPVFANKLRDWLKTLRKKNARVIFVTQSLTDLYNPETQSLTPVTATLLESCPTRLFLPNKNMDSVMQLLYQKIGLNDRQIELIKHIAIPKRHYYVSTPEGNRLIDLGFNEKQSLALAFIGLSKEKSARLIEMKKTYGTQWIGQWLIQNGLEAWAHVWEENYQVQAQAGSGVKL